MAMSVKLKKSNLDLAGAVLPRANLSRTNLTAANLERTNLSGADLSLSILVGANLKKAVLRSANLAHADLSEADLSGADLSGANLSSAKMASTNFSLAKFDKADFRGANLSGAKNLSWPALLDAFLDTETVLPEDLGDSDFFNYLEAIHPTMVAGWRAESQGRAKVVIAELIKGFSARGGHLTIGEAMRTHRVFEMMELEKNQRPNVD